MNTEVDQIFSVRQQDIGDNLVVTVLDIKELNQSLKKYIDEHLVEVCEGVYSDSTLENVKENIRALFKDKNSKDPSKFSNWEMGAVAELFIHLYLKYIGLKQECLFLNLEERSIKKGFDGYYSDDSEQWIMESKSGSIHSVNATHPKKLNEAITDLANKISGVGSKNNPWRNAFNHASLVDVGSADGVRKYLKQLSIDFLHKKTHHIDEFNIIPCATIYFEEKEFESQDNILSSVSSIINEREKKSHLICVSHTSVVTFKDYIGIK